MQTKRYCTMDATINRSSSISRRFIAGWLIAFVGLSLWAILTGRYKVVAISWLAFGAMAVMIPWGCRSARRQVSLQSSIVAYGISAGAMITSASLFLVPQAIHQDSVYGGLGIAAGLIGGFALQQFNQHIARHTPVFSSSIVSELTVHTLAAGVVIGMIYAAMPRLSLLLGIAIISHKAPAGYAAARRLTTEQKNPWILLIPAASLGIMALPVSLFHLSVDPIVTALIFGVATGIFLHLGVSFFPKGDNHLMLPDESSVAFHHHLKSVASLAAGGGVVFFLWLVFH